MSAFIFEGRDRTQRSGHEKIAMRNIKWAAENIIGQYYNEMSDYGEDANLFKSRNEIAEMLYECSMENAYGKGYEGSGKAPREMRFAGEKFCKAYIDWLINNDLYYVDMIDEILEFVESAK